MSKGKAALGSKTRKTVMARIANADVVLQDPKRRRQPLSPKEARFVEIWIGGAGQITMRDAALEAGYTKGSAARMANHLTDPAKCPHVVAYIRKRQNELNEKYGTTLEKHMRDMMMLRDRCIEAGAWAAAVQAEYRRGQAIGTIYIDRKEIRHGSIDSMSKEEVQRKLDELKRIYQPLQEVVDVSEEDITMSVKQEAEADHSEELTDEERELIFPEDEEGDDEDEDNPGGERSDSGVS
jgi:hypothetical protein